jgi:uncharacterized oxidoreductase
MPILTAPRLIEFASDLFQAAGVARDEAAIVARSLVEANLRGHDSHGVMRTSEYVKRLRTGEVVSGAEFRMLTDLPGLLLADANYGFGQVQCRRLVEAVSAKARAQGVACGALRWCGHIGRLSEWVELAAAQGLAAWLAVNDNGSEYSVAPPGGTAARISTNPIAFAVPTGGEPLVLDISTSAVANGKVKVARLAGKPCPPGWVQDAEGQPSTDPHVLLADPPGTLLPLGGDQAYKGFGLGVLIDVLVSGLTGGFCPPHPGAKESNNVLLVVWDPDKFAGHAHFRAEADHLIESIRNTPRKPGVDRILLPGDRSAEVRRQREREGIPLSAGDWDSLTHVAQELGVAVPPGATKS